MVDKTQYGWGAERRRMFTFFSKLRSCGVRVGVLVGSVCVHRLHTYSPAQAQICVTACDQSFHPNQLSSGFRLGNGDVGLG